MQAQSPAPALRWDIFCRVIDNFGDIGVCWRLACNLAQSGQTARLWVDDTSALTWMAPQGAPGVEVRTWSSPVDMTNRIPGDVLVEAFGCDIDPDFIATYADFIRTSGEKCKWINLEYLSAEAFAARCHGLPSPVMSGPGRGLTKHFFYPGFTATTGGLLREPDLIQRQTKFDRGAWLSQLGLTWQGERLVSLFCYEPAGLSELLDTLAADPQPTCLLVTQGRASDAVRAEVSNKNRLKPLWNNHNSLSFCHLPQLEQNDFDHLLWACDLNFVRGEDSLVRALWAGKPFVWHIYPQGDGAHHAKLYAFMDWLQAPPSLRSAHDHWNGLDKSATSGPNQHWLSRQDLIEWQTTATKARKILLTQKDLAHALLDFVSKTH